MSLPPPPEDYEFENSGCFLFFIITGTFLELYILFSL